MLAPDRAHHQSYWQTVRAGPDNEVTAGAMGRHEELLVKQNVEWLIAARRIIPFGD